MTAEPPSAARPLTPPALAVWEFAGLILTYACSARCAFCYVHGGPHQSGGMTPGFAVGLWQGLARLAAGHGRQMRVHLTGGEPFDDWPRLAAVVRAAREAGLGPIEKIETNASWATDENLARARLELLDKLGLERLIVSADVFHQEFVPFERVQNCVAAARRALGPGRLIVRWWDFFQRPVIVRGRPAADRAAAFRVALAHHPERLSGRAAECVAALLPTRPAAEHCGQSCAAEVLASRHVHIDPTGHVFPGTCAGIILGQLPAGPTTPRAVVELWERLAHAWPHHPVLAAVVAGGSYELFQRVQALGYRESEAGYASKCHLCWDVRRFLIERGLWREYVGPPACYGRPTGD